MSEAQDITGYGSLLARLDERTKYIVSSIDEVKSNYNESKQEISNLRHRVDTIELDNVKALQEHSTEADKKYVSKGEIKTIRAIVYGACAFILVSFLATAVTMMGLKIGH